MMLTEFKDAVERLKSATQPIDRDVLALLERVESDFEFYEQRAKELYGQLLDIKQKLQSAIKIVKSNNEHVRKLKGFIHQAIELCK